ncbi:Rossmann-like and DUF2520 domain-containing protein [Massilia yuzhufengensis]|uniref:Predicted oxidoreductase, contains short-chain dehydrogenase (SDR) and DUF2520 domains n=1 Tax=Massilia yuzhufengensis TaxID=1164594 RepID=A0A1I1DL97_9BURK|nr:DUF2520 domain-containing protein [Massilia yuzhufengensis]SFB73293.1 Predicted oxidoreductase, contains short-chain dehydrogenase (SDR) and DUF2520 domains [Massilia yuzhufengensis]
MAATLNLVGAGHVGRALGRVFAASGAFALQDVGARSAASAQAAVDVIGAGHACAGLAHMRPAQVWMLAVGDDQIGPVCAALAGAQPLAGAVVFHCSGAKASSELQPAIDAGALVASVHPVRSFADPAAVAADFAGTFCGIEGDPGALALLEPAFEAAGARLVRIDPAAKTVYHAAAVFASNYLVTVVDAALRAYQAAGVSPAVARELARPLATEALANVFRLGPEAALSGPVARGDVATVARQHAAVTGWDAPTGQLYEALVAPTADLARRKHGAS